MGIYDKEGYCTCFESYAMKLEDQKRAKKLLDLIGQRKAFIVYDEGMLRYGGRSSIVKLLLNDANSEKIAFTLGIMIPEAYIGSNVDEKSIGKKILVKDVLNPEYIPGVHCLTGKTWSFLNSEGGLNVNRPIFSEKDGKRVLFCSDKFVAVLENEEEQVVVWIFEYPSDSL